MTSNVDFKRAISHECLTANFAIIRSLPRVSFEVVIQVSVSGESSLALITLKRLYT